MASQRKEVQSHGFSWEREILQKVYKITDDELKTITYTSKMDLPAIFNRIGEYDLSIKTTCKSNYVCMADCLRIYDCVSSCSKIHMIVIVYKQDDNTKTKKITSIRQVDLTLSTDILFGTITRDQLVELANAVKAVPQKRKPTKEEYDKMYSIRNKLQLLSGEIHLDIKCNSQQSRLQCSFNNFERFLNNHSDRIVKQSYSNVFYDQEITAEIQSSRRKFKKSIISI
jgi:hypothetical protein